MAPHLPVRGRRPNAAAVARPEHGADLQPIGVAVAVAKCQPDVDAERKSFDKSEQESECVADDGAEQ